MGSGQPIGTESALGKPGVTLDASTALPLSENTEGGGSMSSSGPIAATTPTAAPATWSNAALEVLKSKAGLVAGALADFQGAKGIVATSALEYDSHGRRCKALKLILIVEDADIVTVNTPDGLDFDVVAGA